MTGRTATLHDVQPTHEAAPLAPARNGHDVDWRLLQADGGAVLRDDGAALRNGADHGQPAAPTVLDLQSLAGNQAVSRLVASPPARRRTSRRRRPELEEAGSGMAGASAGARGAATSV